jgi:protein-S-isoprenylcysteine O-methyltransferase Ste14
MVSVSTGAEIRLPPPVVYFGPLALTWGLQRWRPWTTPGGTSLSVAALVLIASGILLMVWSFVTLRRANTTVIPWEHVSAMVTTGPFRISRNPIYLADAITYLGGSLLLHSWWPLLALPAVLVVMRRKVIDREERYLTERFGEAYREYQHQVRRWL